MEHVCPIKDQFVSNTFIVKKMDGGSRPVIYFVHFKMENLQSLRTLLQKNEYMCKLDVKDAYLSVPHSQDDRKRVMFQWEETMCQFLYLYFGLAPGPYVYTKLLKIPMAYEIQSFFYFSAWDLL